MSEQTWPNGKRVAVLISILFESWSDGKWPSYFPRTSPLKPGTIDRGAIQWGQFGGNEGLWRILRTLDRHDVKATVLASGRAGELYPEVLKQATKSGHAIGGHGWTQDGLFAYMTPDEERAALVRTLEALEKASGQRPKGWATPAYSWTDKTFDICVQEGVTWYADALDCSLPRRETTPSGTIVAFPWSDFVDNRVLRGNPESYFDVYKSTYDYLSAHEPMSMIHVGFHSHFGGRPLMTGVFDRLLAFFKAQPDVWMPGHEALAQWAREQPHDTTTYAQRFFG